MANVARVEDRFAQIRGAFTDPNAIMPRLKWAAENAHLISPATSCGVIPEGIALTIAIVPLNPDSDTHDVGMGKRGLLKHAIQQIANAAGVAFDPSTSGRLDDGSDPFYCHWRAIGAWQHMDFTPIPLLGEKEMDLRDGSAQVDKIFASAKSREAGAKQLMEMRAFIMGHAQTKAELRAIRKGLGLRSYTREELARPFIVVRPMFTGASSDPQIRRENVAALRERALGGVRAIFGAPAQAITVPSVATALLPAPVAHATPLPPPPVGSRRVAPDEVDALDDMPPLFPPQQGAPAPAQPSAQAPQNAPAETTGGAGPIAKFGKSKGEPLSSLSESDLTWYVGVCRQNVEDPAKARYRRSNEEHLREVLLELEQRNGVPVPGPDEIDRGPDPNNW